MNRKIEKDLRMLFVEDDEDLRHIFLYKLRDEFEGLIQTAQSGNEGIEFLTKNSFDIIISDFEMSNGSGLDLLRFKIEKNISSPFIFFTHALNPRIPYSSTEYTIVGKNDFQVLCKEIRKQLLLKKIF